MSVILRGSDSASVLYLSYDGMTDDIGQSQVLPYLLGCASAGHRIVLVSFEKDHLFRERGATVSLRLKAAGIEWRPNPFRSSPPLISKLLDQLSIARAARKALREKHFDLVHARSYIAGRGALKAMTNRDRFLFDMRGFWVDQRREGGRWVDSSFIGRFLYRRWKALEGRMIARADQIVVLADAARVQVEAMQPFRGQPVSVIPCCTDFELFTPATKDLKRAARANLGLSETALVISWLGSLGTVYRPDLLFRLFDEARRSFGNVQLLFIGRHSAEELIKQAAALGIALSPFEVFVRHCDRSEVSDALAAADLGTCFIKPGGSSAGVSPTKLGEMQACGLPVIANRGVGDVEAQIAETQGGLTLADESQRSIREAVKAIPDLIKIDRESIRERARALFDLPISIASYDKIYRSFAINGDRKDKI